ncbi:DUF2806 domain-containing protein [Thermodesulfobacteriota bacterium]
MTNNNIPFDLTKLAEPATQLIKAVRSALGILYEPTRIRRMAKALVDAERTMAEGRSEIKDIESRAMRRLLTQEVRHQENIEIITKLALKSLPDKVSDNLVDQDWVHQFFDYCKDVSNEQMQSLWAKLLAGEVVKPGTFSRRTLRVVKDLDKEEAQLFTKLCTFVWQVDDETTLWPIFLGFQEDLLRKAELDFMDLIDLDTAGLIKHDQAGYSTIDIKEIKLSYFGRKHKLKVKGTKSHIIYGDVALTVEGSMLAPISGATPSEEYRSFIVDQLKINNFIVED